MASPKRANSDVSPDEEGRSPKRQRRSFSPDSPSISTEAKESSTEAQPPQTPPPSVHMSPEWQAQQLPGLGLAAGNNGNGGSTSGSVTFPTPPSTAGFQSQMMARGTSSEGGYDSESQTRRDTSQAESTTADDVPISGMEDGDAEHRRSDHEREDTARSLPVPLPLYKLHTESVAPSAPNPSQDLISLYALNGLQASVARRDPQTGAKINKLRKSYEGKVKDLGLEGRNKATKAEKILCGLLEPEWDDQISDGMSRWEASPFVDPPLLGQDDGAGAMRRIEDLLGAALDLRPGHLPASEHNGWKNLLGLDDTAAVGVAPKTAVSPSATATTAFGAPRTAATNLISKTAPTAALRNSAPASPRNALPSALRPDRAGKKRRYDESSYAGYQEGYEDDGYSTGGVDDATGRRSSGGGGKRQKRKDFTSSTTPSNSPPFATSAGGSNGMVGVRSS